MFYIKKRNIDNILQIGEKLMIKTALDYELFESRLENFDENNIYITPPKYDGKTAIIRRGTSLNVSIQDASSNYSFDTKVKGVSTEGEHLIILDKPSSFSQKQLRDFFRIHIDEPTSFFLGDISKYNEFKSIGRARTNKATITEISGGGAQISTKSELILNDSVVLNLSNIIPELDLVEAKVVRVNKKFGKGYSCALTFTLISETKRDFIIRYIFKKQLQKAPI